jgi:glycerol uptake facilitator-like aquaporin
MAMIYAVGQVSGAHFNPAVSFALWLYLLAPLTGATLGGIACQFIRGETVPG